MNREFERQIAREVCSVVECCMPDISARRITRATELNFDSNQRLKMMHHLYIRYGFVMRESEAIPMKTIGDVTSWYVRRADKLLRFNDYLKGITAHLRRRQALNESEQVRFSSQLREHTRPFDLVLSRMQHVQLVTDLLESYRAPSGMLSQAKTVAELCEVLYSCHDTVTGPITEAEILRAVAILSKYRLNVSLKSFPDDAESQTLTVLTTKSLSAASVPFYVGTESDAYEHALIGAVRSWLRLNEKEDVL